MNLFFVKETKEQKRQAKEDVMRDVSGEIDALSRSHREEVDRKIGPPISRGGADKP